MTSTQSSTAGQHGGNSVAVEIPGVFGKRVVTFTNDAMSDGKRTIAYKDAARVWYHAVNQSINFVPTAQRYSFPVASAEQRIWLNFGTTLYIGNKKRMDAWTRLIAISQRMIEPLAVQKCLNAIFVSGNTLRIGGVALDRSGFTKTKMFGGRVTIPWSEVAYIPSYSRGAVVCWGKKNDKAYALGTVPMSTPNSVVLPSLFQACITAAQKRGG